MGLKNFGGGSGGSVAWGGITGTLSNQTDLQTALNAKQDISAKNQPSGYVGINSDGSVGPIILEPRSLTAAVMATTVLNLAEIATTSDTHAIKIGDGVTAGGLNPTNTATPTTFTLGGVQLTNPKFVNARANNLPASTATDVYTCPAGRRAAVVRTNYEYGATTGTMTAATYVKISGTQYPLIAPVSLSGNTTGGPSVSPGYVMEAGEVIGILTGAGTAGPTVQFQVIEYDVACPLKTAKLTTFINGNNLLYSPSGVTATVLDNGFGVAAITTGNYFNPSLTSTNVTIQSYIVPSGQSPGTAYIALASVLVGAGTASAALKLASSLASGDQLYINANNNVAGPIAWVTVAEF